MTHKELIVHLRNNNIPFVLIGGTAMRLYNSPRATFDIDFAVRTLDIDVIIELMYTQGYVMVTAVNEKDCSVALTPTEAQEWVETEKAGSISFVMPNAAPASENIPHREIDPGTQIDFIFDLNIPFIRLLQNGQKIELKDTSFYIASAEDLLQLKQERQDKTEADLDDIRFLKRLLNH